MFSASKMDELTMKHAIGASKHTTAPMLSQCHQRAKRTELMR